jgi:uncharacterized OB-fold protein
MKQSPIKIWRKQPFTRQFLGKIGEVITWTEIHTALQGMENYTPYFSALIEFADGKKVFGQVVDCTLEEIAIGKKVKAVLRKLREPEQEDVVDYGLKFVIL